MRGFRGMKNLIVGQAAARLARNINKDDFLRQLKDAWRPHVKKYTPIEDELAAAMRRIKGSGFQKAFNTIGVTESEILTVLEEIRGEKTDPVRVVDRKVGRNDPCPCGSGLKYKKCCGRSR